MKLYRKTPKNDAYLGPGSYWAESPDIAVKYGKGKVMHETDSSEPVLRLKMEDDVIKVLTTFGMSYEDAEKAYENGGWAEGICLALLATRWSWVRSRIDDTQHFQWIRLR